ncbi:MAG: alpha/beta hydrolase [Pseudomonadales bacterium]|nr:alpha/beta hydrolase [Pseudomonadales bacterium]
MFMQKLLVFLMLGLLHTAVSAQAGPTDTPPEIDILRDLTFVQYGEATLQLDLYRPAQSSETLPVVIVIREGGWAHGEKEASGPLASALARRGLASASIEYRGASEAVFPAYINDVKAAIRWLRANASAYNLDPDAIGAIGGSWGGYLAVYAGVTPDVAEFEGDGEANNTSSSLSAVVGISAPLNLADFPESMERFLGESYKSNPSLWEFASATTHTSKNSPPLLLIASQADTTVPYEQSLLMAQAYGKAGAEIEIHLLPEVGHAPFWQYNLRLHDKVAEFFHRHLKSE